MPQLFDGHQPQTLPCPLTRCNTKKGTGVLRRPENATAVRWSSTTNHSAHTGTAAIRHVFPCSGVLSLLIHQAHPCPFLVCYTESGQGSFGRLRKRASPPYGTLLQHTGARLRPSEPQSARSWRQSHCRRLQHLWIPLCGFIAGYSSMWATRQPSPAPTRCNTKKEFKI